VVPVDRRSSPNVTPGRQGHRPLGIVVHTAVGSLEGTAAWFEQPESGVSAHVVVGLDGRLVRVVDEADTARHAGRPNRPTAAFLPDGIDPNLVTIGVEFVDDGDPTAVLRPDAQYAAGAELLWALGLRWSIPLDRDHVVGHREIDAEQTCPGNLDIDRLLREAVALDADP
jgi:N-acetyl-anhydromuramyl-L-alanine amidase AmpD